MGRNAQAPAGISDLIAQIERLQRQVTAEASRQRSPVVPVLADAGKTTASDGDFDVPPVDGALSVVINTTDSSVRLAVRANDVWKMSAALT